MDRPSVFSYIRFRDFLRDWLAHRKREDPAYSLMSFATEGGCSKAAIANVLSGARSPRPGTLDAFGRAMDLSPPERNYLGLLVELEGGRTLEERRQVMNRILSAEHYQQVRVVEGEQGQSMLRYVEHWYTPVIRELARLPGFVSDPAWIAAAVQPPITVQEAEAAVNTLLELEYLERRPDGTLVPTAVRVRTHDETLQKAAQHVFRTVIPRMLSELDVANASIQHLRTGTMSIAPSQMPEFKARLDAVIEQLATMADDQAEAGPRRVYQLAVQLMPVSDEIQAPVPLENSTVTSGTK